jgi:tetratricopeptide (TPR) repeat protein
LAFGELYPEEVAPSQPFRRTGAVRLSKVRISRLRHPSPPEESAPLDVRAAYWEARHAAEGADSRAALMLGFVRLEQERLDDVLSLAAWLLESPHPLVGARALKGRALFLLRRYKEALAALTAANDEPGDDPLVLATLAEILAAAPDESLRDGQRARGLAELAVSVSAETDPVAHAALAAALAELGQFDEARKENLKAIQAASGRLMPLLEQRQAVYEAGKPLRLPKAEP